MKSIEIRKEHSDEWEKHRLTEGHEFAALTDIITKARSDKTARENKICKGLKRRA